MEFNEKLQLLRQTKGISQEMLAEEIGVPKKLVVDWEAGKELPDMQIGRASCRERVSTRV